MICQNKGETDMYTVYSNIEDRDAPIHRRRTLASAGRAYQAACTGNLRRVIDQHGQDVTQAACDAANLAE